MQNIYASFVWATPLETLSRVSLLASLDSLDSHATEMHAELSHFWRWYCGGDVVLWCCFLASG